jgi:hypothetical protein
LIGSTKYCQDNFNEHRLEKAENQNRRAHVQTTKLSALTPDHWCCTGDWRHFGIFADSWFLDDSPWVGDFVGRLCANTSFSQENGNHYSAMVAEKVYLTICANYEILLDNPRTCLTGMRAEPFA